MRSMALDLGTKTIGIAISDTMEMIARGVETIRRRTLVKDFQRLSELIKENEITTIVVGYPKNMNGSIGEKALSCASFAELVKADFPAVEVVLWDERLSTVAAERVLIDADLRREKRRKVIDMMAAVVILQNYLDSKKNSALKL
ncbi:MAG: Holliday junction resolvase RuvX [Acidaminococcaceae bacterium]